MVLPRAMPLAPYGATPRLNSCWGPTSGEDPNFGGLIAGGEPVIDGVKDKFQAVGYT
jgi:hypothetical protein